MKNLIIVAVLSLIGINAISENNEIPPKVILELEEEAYIDDIPFNTKEVVEEYFLSQIELEEETYVDDIPFDTEKVLCEHLNKESNKQSTEIVIINALEDLNIDVVQIVEDINKAVEYSIQIIEEENIINEIKYRTIKILNVTSSSTGF